MQNGLFNVTEEQQSLVELIRDFMTKEIKPHVLEWEKEGHYPQEIIEQGIEWDCTCCRYRKSTAAWDWTPQLQL